MKQIAVICSLACIFVSNALTAAPKAQNQPQYHVAKEIPLAGDEGWDYLTVDSAGKRLFVTHGSRVLVLSTDDYALLGEIADTPGVHGVALANDLNRGYISAGRSGMIVVFDLKTLARLQEIKTSGDNPDAILYDPSTQRVFSFNGRGRNVTVVDAKTNTVVATIAVDAKPEFGVTDLAGHVYVNLEDKNSIAMLDAKQAKVQAVWPLAGCEEPSGLAIDRKHARLFTVCANKTMLVVDAKSGRIVASLPIGGRVDGAGFDAKTGLAFASGGDGTLTVVHEDNANKFTVVQTAITKIGARTMAVDEATHRVFTATAKFHLEVDKPTQRPAMLPGSFEVLMLEP